MDRRVAPPKRVTSPTWGPPPPYDSACCCFLVSLGKAVLHVANTNDWFNLIVIV